MSKVYKSEVGSFVYNSKNPAKKSDFKKNLTKIKNFITSRRFKTLFEMSRVCQKTGKRTSSGQNRPFSLKATKRTFRPNLFWKRMWNPETGRVERMRLSAKAIKTLKKLAKKAGFMTDAEKKAEKAKLAGQNPQHTTNKEKGRVHKIKLTPKQKKELAAAEEAAKKAKAATFDTDVEKKAA